MKNTEQTRRETPTATTRRHVCWLAELNEERGACCTVDPGPDPTWIPDEIPEGPTRRGPVGTLRAARAELS